MIAKYTRKQINQDPSGLGKEEFALMADVIKFGDWFLTLAIKAGADEGKMRELIKGKVH